MYFVEKRVKRLNYASRKPSSLFPTHQRCTSVHPCNMNICTPPDELETAKRARQDGECRLLSLTTYSIYRASLAFWNLTWLNPQVFEYFDVIDMWIRNEGFHLIRSVNSRECNSVLSYSIDRKWNVSSQFRASWLLIFQLSYHLILIGS